MNTHSSIVRLVALLVCLLGLTVEQGKGETTTARWVRFAIEEASQFSWDNLYKKADGHGLYLKDPVNQIPTLKVRVSGVIRFVGNTTGVDQVIHCPNFPTGGGIGFTGYWYDPRKTNVNDRQNAGGSMAKSIAGSVYTSPDDQDPNPTTGRARIYWLDERGQLASVSGTPIKHENPTVLNLNDGGPFYVSPDPELRVYELHIEGVEIPVTQGFINAYRNLRSNAAAGAKWDLVIQVTFSGLQINYTLPGGNGCMVTPRMPDDIGIPLIHCGSQNGAVAPFESEFVTAGAKQVLRFRGRIGSLPGALPTQIEQATGDLTSWRTLEPSEYSVTSLPNGITEVALGSSLTRTMMVRIRRDIGPLPPLPLLPP